MMLELVCQGGQNDVNLRGNLFRGGISKEYCSNMWTVKSWTSIQGQEAKENPLRLQRF